MRHIPDDERRRRLARRHAVSPQHRVGDPLEATRAMTVLHATEAASVHLSVASRTREAGVEAVSAALYDERCLVKQIAMRRTLFVFPRDLLPATWGSASARVAEQERRRAVKDVSTTPGLPRDGAAWVEEACAAVLSAVTGSGGMTAAEVREQVPMVAGRLAVSPGTKWGTEVPAAPRILTILGARGQLVRGADTGHWRAARNVWTTTAEWLDEWREEAPTPLSEPEGYAELVRRWLLTFGPGTLKDIQWWLGSTVTSARTALADVGAVEVSLDGGATGWVHPDDVDEEEPVAPWAALLPVLDPTTMGWKERDFYLAPEDRPYLFDTNGNAGTTAWWNGRIVGCWVQDDAGVVRVVPRGSLPPEAEDALALECRRLTAWLDGVRVNSLYATRQMKSARLPRVCPARVCPS